MEGSTLQYSTMDTWCTLVTGYCPLAIVKTIGSEIFPGALCCSLQVHRVHSGGFPARRRRSGPAGRDRVLPGRSDRARDGGDGRRGAPAAGTAGALARPPPTGAPTKPAEEGKEATTTRGGDGQTARQAAEGDRQEKGRARGRCLCQFLSYLHILLFTGVF